MGRMCPLYILEKAEPGETYMHNKRTGISIALCLVWYLFYQCICICVGKYAVQCICIWKDTAVYSFLYLKRHMLEIYKWGGFSPLCILKKAKPGENVCIIKPAPSTALKNQHKSLFKLKEPATLCSFEVHFQSFPWKKLAGIRNNVWRRDIECLMSIIWSKGQMDGLSENTKSFSYDRFHGSEAQRGPICSVQCPMFDGIRRERANWGPMVN